MTSPWTPSTASLAPAVMSTPDQRLLEETGDGNVWILFTTGIIVGTLLLEMGFVSLIAICRTCQVRKEKRLKEHIYHTIGEEQRSTIATENRPSSSVTLTHYVNLPKVETHTQPVDIPTNTTTMTSSTTKARSDTITNSAYSAGIHYACIPGEPSPPKDGAESKPSSMSEHVYSVIKDEKSTAKKQTQGAKVQVQAKQKETQKQPHQELQHRYQNEPLEGKRGTGLSAGNHANQPVEMESDRFIELMPRNLKAYDTLKRGEQQEFPEVSLLTTSGSYDKLLSPDECPVDLTAAKFNPYGQLSDEFLNDTEIPIIETAFNPYDDIVSAMSQHPSLQASTNCSTAVSRNDLAGSHGKLDEPNSHNVDPNDEMSHTYDVIDELQKQIHILSQSIPTLDMYGYEDLDKIKPVPKASMSIPILDVAGYEDFDAVKPTKDPALSKRQLTKATDVNFGLYPYPYEDMAAKKRGRHSVAGVIGTEECPPLVPPHTIESLYTAVQKKPRSSTITQAGAAAAGEVKKKPLLDEKHLTTGTRSKKSSSTNDLDVPPPVPKLTVDAFYTAVQKPKKSSEKPPQIPPKFDVDTNPPSQLVASLYADVRKKPKVMGPDHVVADDEVPPPRPPKTLEEHYLLAQKEGVIPPLPPRTVERLYSDMYRHREEKVTEL